MITIPVEFTDFNGAKRTVPCSFNLMETEILDMQAKYPGGIMAHINKIMTEDDPAKLVPLFSQLVLDSYGEPDADGIHFNKSPEITARFKNSLMYPAVFNYLVTDDNAADFVNGLIPNAEKVDREAAIAALPEHLRPANN